MFFSTWLLLAISFGIGGYIMVDTAFTSMLDQRVNQTLEENLLVRFALETAVMSMPENKISDEAVAAAASELAYNARYWLRVSESGRVIYANETLTEYPMWTDGIENNTSYYRLQEIDGSFYLHTVIAFTAQGTAWTFVLEHVRNISSLYAEREAQFQVYRHVLLAVVAGGGILVYVMAALLTRPLRRLLLTTRRITGGRYEERAPVHRSSDEIGEFTASFNKMADVVEEKIHALEQEARSREDFVGNFAHELKTPLTSIIGYADMLRSRELTPEQFFRAAHYIFREGRRLEALSLKLMDMIVLRRQSIETRRVNALLLVEETAGVLAPVMEEYGMVLQYKAEPAVLRCDPDLIKTLLINLLDNARKASEPGAVIGLEGIVERGEYVLGVRDHGRGIPKQDLDKITEAFYMVDKSRSRAQHGAGLGLALCDEIARLHGARLLFESELGKGTLVRLIMPLEGMPSGAGRKGGRHR